METPLAVKQETILPGTFKAILTLASGEQVSLEDMLNDSLQKDGMLIRKGIRELSYEQTTGLIQEGAPLFNTITIPRSGEYKLTLSDGTRVWLNSASELRYPVKFTEDRRQVFLKGEAYFEVTGDAGHPFVVKTANVDVKILGTGFNVMAYPDDTKTEVTLVHGKVEVQTDKQQLTLQPEEQYVHQIATHLGEVRKVDVTQYIDWKQGVLNFEAMPLEDLTRRLGRWYDVDFYFTSRELKELKYSGAFKKYNELRYVLNIIEEITNVQFVVNNRTVIVNRK